MPSRGGIDCFGRRGQRGNAAAPGFVESPGNPEMYCSFYGIQEKPFSITPDPKYLFLGKTHKEAFAHLIYGIRERGGFIVITGDIGTGKTTLCRALLSHLDADTMVAFIFNPMLSALELLK